MDIIDCFVSLLVTSLEALGCVLLEAFYNFSSTDQSDMAEQVPQAVAGRALAQVVQNPQPAHGEPTVAQQAQDQPLAQQAQNQEVCISFCFGHHVIDYISVAKFYR